MTAAPPRSSAMPRYSALQRALHWLTALAILGVIPLGFYIEGYEAEAVEAANAALGPGGFDLLYALHKSLGLTILGLMILRIVARAGLGAPPHVPPLPRWQKIAAEAVHGLLYLVLLATPLVGWIGVSLYPAPADFWFLADLALPLTPDRETSEALLGDVHGPLAILALLLIAAHVLAALKHRLLDRDQVLSRML